MTFKQQTTFKGLCITGPKAGEWIENTAPIYRVSLDDLGSIPPYKEFIYHCHSEEVYDTKEDYRPSMIDETVTFGFWIPDGWTLVEIMKELMSNYKPKENQ